MTCELSGHTNCPIVELSNQINGLNLHLDGIGTQIASENNPDILLSLGETASSIASEIEALENRKNAIHKCRVCLVSV